MKTTNGTVVQTVHSIRKKAVAILAVLLCIVAANQVSYGQCTPTPLLFNQKPTITGAPGVVGTTYRRTNVFSGVDVEFKIDSIYGGATLRSEDVSSDSTNPDNNAPYSGYTQAWQPVVVSPNNTTAGEAAIRWVVSFFVNGTSFTTPYTFNCVSLMGVDVDGDGDQLQEFVQVTNPYSFSGSATGTTLNYSSNTGRLRSIARDATGYNSIDSTVKSAMVVFRYKNVNTLRYTTGFTKGTNTVPLLTRAREFCLFFGFNTNFPNSFSRFYDTDGDGVTDINDPIDLDDDNDGIRDVNEYIAGYPDPLLDADGDGLANYEDPTPGFTVAGIANFWSDTNGDGVNDRYDSDRDGTINSLDRDSDNDGIPDLVEAGGVDANGDGIVDYTGTFESNDTDGDGLIDRYDDSENNPNVTGVTIRNLDSDGDGIPNIIDLDSDNDGIPDVVEAGGTDVNGDGRIDNFSDNDFDGLSDQVDGDIGDDGTVENGGAAALILTGTYTSTSNPNPVSYPQGVANDDGRDLPNFLDLDSDDDGIADVTEASGTDADYNGRLDYTGTFAANDVDNDGFLDSVDGNVAGVLNPSKALLATGADTNNDGRPDSYPNDNADGTFRPNPYDADSDDDGIPDLIEAGGVDSNGGGRIDAPYTDANGNGWLDSYDPTATNGINLRILDANGATAGGLVFDFDGDGKPNYIDLDSDNDGIADIIEQGGTDTNNDGKVDLPANTTYAQNDLDNDGFIDVYDPVDNRISGTAPSGKTPLITAVGPVDATTKLPATYSVGDNFDGTGLINMLDLDADGDGLIDTRESGINVGTGITLDVNNDGVINSSDAGYTDTNGDGWDDRIDNLASFVLRNSDGTGNPNYLDLDSDNDGILDNIEGQTTPGYIAPSGADTDFDGIDNSYDPTTTLGTTSNGFALADTDGDGISDYRDIDSDNDGIVDNIEGQTTAGYVVPSGVDTDGDGIDNTYDLTPTTIGATGNGFALTDTDGDGTLDYRDTDSDNDGKSDRIEGWDTNGNGRIDGAEKAYVGTTDTDGDGLLNEYDAVTNGAGTAVTNVTNNTTPASYPDVNNPGGNRDWRQAQDTDRDGISDIVDLDDDNDGIPDSVECPTCATDIFQNGSFELPAQGGSNASQVLSVPGWNTTATDGKIEIWSNNYNGVPAAQGVQFVEINATQASTLYQNFCLNGTGATILWSVKHRGRAGVDVASLGFGTSATSLTTVATLTDGNSSWGVYNGSYTVAAGITDLYIGLTAISTAAGDVTVGNFVDDVQITIIQQSCDTDGDGIPNTVDLDSDGDGIPDLVEAGGIDTDGNGTVDFTGTFASNDTDNDGLIATYDASTGGVNIANLDTDGDGIPNFKDLDSDGDGIPDVIEAGGADANNDGKLDAVTDTDMDGLADLVDGDANNDGTVENTAGALVITSIVGATPGRPASYPRANLDATGLPNFLDLDSDGDGILDARESGIASGTGTQFDTNNDGTINSTDAGYADANGDGWADAVDNLASYTLRNTDGIGNANYLDIDSDDDGIVDNIENQTTAGYIAPVGTDGDGDGIDDAYDNNDALFAGAANNGLALVDTDGDGTSDYRDLDSDNDGKSDRIEGWDTNGNGIIDGAEKAYVGTTDTDGDGLLNEYDAVTNGAGTAVTNVTNNTTPASYPDKNNPGGDRDWRQLQDADKDGIADITDLDDDNDGIPDTVECPNCTTKVFTNGSFELPAYGDVGFHLTTTVPGWNTTQPDGQMEIWSNSYLGITPFSGTQLLELNAAQAATVYQNFCLNGKGATILWTVRHRGRAGVDVASVGFGASATTLTTVQTMTDGNTAWVSYTGSYTAPAGVTNLVMGLTAVNSSNGNTNEGNLIDGVEITIVNQPCDTDGDGIPDSLDLDSDGDGITDIVEAGGIDANGDGRGDIFVDLNNNGLADVYDPAALVPGLSLPNLDTDGDGIPNTKDLDSDNDGIADVTEAGGTDANYDGKLDNTTDTDIDGLSDLVDGDVGNDGITENTAGALIITSVTGANGRPNGYPRANADAAGLPNPYDLDADDDGIPDLIEAGGVDTNGDGRVDVATDANGNGWRDAYDPTATVPGTNLRTIDANGAAAGGMVFDFDGDGIANYLDADSDNDGIPDIIEQGGTDTNNNGQADATADVDGDGFVDAYDPINNNTAATLGTPLITTGSVLNTFKYPTTYSAGDDRDGTGLINMLDLDADGDGITDVKEAGFAESGTTPGFAAGTLGANGWSTTVNATALPNTDGRGPANYLDIDSDDDGITDNVEGQATYLYKLPLGTDADADGIDDAYDVTNGVGGVGFILANTDNTDVPDYLDLDSDNDGISDLKEGWGDPAFVLTSAEQTADADSDGLLDKFDSFNMTSLTSAMLASMQSNVTMKNMGALGVVPSPLPTLFGSMDRIYKTAAGVTADRDWRNAAIILPVKLISFTAAYSNKVSNVSWTTANEDGHERYILERSIDGISFGVVSSATAKGTATSNYTYADNAVPAVSVVYYRLQLVNADGGISYSKVVAIRLNADKLNVSVYPNPVVDQVSISFASTTTQVVNVKVYNMQGAQVMAQVYKAQAGTNTLQLTNWSKLPVGDYMIEVSNETLKLTHKLTHVK